MNSHEVRNLNMSRGRMEDKFRPLERVGREVGDYGFYNNAQDYYKAERALEKEHKRNEPKTKNRKKKTVI
jgi:hypothetical protein